MVATVRLATPADARRLAELRYDFRAGEATPVESRVDFVARAERWMADRLEPGSAWRCWVALIGAEIVGHLWLQLIAKIPNPVPERESHGYITNVYVDPAHRGAGIGTLLLEAALECCRAAEVDSVILWPTARSRSLYERHGFAVRADIMEAVLDDGRLHAYASVGRGET